MDCLMGYDSIMEASADGAVQPDECSMAYIYVPAYLSFNLVYNLLMVVILKHGSANILWMASTVIVPLSNVAFSLHFIPNHQPMKFMDIVGLVIIMSGLLVYRFTAQLYSVYEKCVGKTISKEEEAIRKKAKKINKMAEKKQTKMVGLNQIEYMNALVDSRVMRAQRMQLFRSPAQARGDLLFKLGIPPSPHITMMMSTPSRGGSSPRYNYSSIPGAGSGGGSGAPMYECSPRFSISPRAQQRRAAQLAAEGQATNDLAGGRGGGGSRPPRRPNEV
jgi:hypothetical protein